MRVWVFLSDGHRWSWLRLLFLLFHHGCRGWTFTFHRTWRVVDQAVWIPVRVTVDFHALKHHRSGWGRLRFFDDGWRRGWSLQFAGGMVSRVTQHWHGTGGHVDDVRLTQGVFVVAQVDDVSLRDGWVYGGFDRCGGWHFLGKRRFAGLVFGGVTFGKRRQNWNAQFTLIVGGVWTVNLFQLSHLLI